MTGEQLGLFERVGEGLTPEGKRLLANFEVVAGAHGGVERLKKLILELAVRGRLVPQTSQDDRAELLLSQIMTERSKVLGERAAPQHVPDRLPPLAPGWCWASLDALLIHLRNGVSTAPAGNSGVPILRISAVRPNQVNVQDFRFLPGRLADYAEFEIRQGDLLFTRYSGNAHYVGICGVVPQLVQPLVHPDKLIRGVACPGLLEPRFIALAVNSGESRRYVDTCARTTAGQVGISGRQLKATPVPLPPLAEQKRIVAKVDELMKLCDDLEAGQAQQRETAGRLTKAALGALFSAKGPEELAESWRRVAGSFEVLLQEPEAIGSLRMAILELGVRGFLSGVADRSPTDGLPLGWLLASVHEVADKVTDGDHLTPRRAPKGRFLLSARNVRDGSIALDAVDFVPEDEFVRMRRRCDPNSGDVLLSCSGSVGRVAVVDRDDTYVMVRSAAMIRPKRSRVVPEYLHYALRSPTGQKQMVEKSRASAQANLFVGRIKEIVIPIPPVAEQHRLVAKIDALMSLCDALEAALRRAEDTATKLADALVAELLA